MMVYLKDSVNDVQAQISWESPVFLRCFSFLASMEHDLPGAMSVSTGCAALSLSHVVLCIYRNLPGHLQRQAVYLIAFSWCYVATSVYPPVNSLRRPKNLYNFLCPSFPLWLSEKLARIPQLLLLLILELKGWRCLMHGCGHISHIPVHRSKM